MKRRLPGRAVPWPAIWRHAAHPYGRTCRGLFAGFLLQSLSIDSSASAQCTDYSHGIHWVGTVEELGSFHMNSGHAVARSGPFLYAVVVNDGLDDDGYYFSFYVLDLDGNLLGRCSLRGEPRAVSVGGTPVGGGTYAYVAISERGLQVLDISNPTDPRVVRTVDTPGHAYDVAVAGTHVYVADGSSGVHVVDVAYPPLATLGLTVETPGVARGVTIDGTRLYVAAGESGLQIMDASNPGLPRMVGSVDTPGLANDVAVTGSCAYVANGGHDPGQGYAGGFAVVDVSTPAAPVVVPATLPPEFLHVLGFALEGSRLYTVGYSGMTLFDVGEPFEPMFLGRGDCGGYGIAVAGDRAYVGGGNGLEIQDASLPMSAAPIEATSLDTAVYAANDFFFSGPTMYVADGGNDEEGHTIAGGLRIHDLSTRQSIGRLDLPGASAVALCGAHAVVLDYDHFYSIDVSNPTTPRLVGDLGIGGYAIAVSGSVAYVAGREGLKVIDLSIPSAPQVVATMDSLLSVSDVEVRGNQLLVHTVARGLSIFEITHPESPVRVGSVPLPLAWGSLVVRGNTVHVSAGGALTSIDISDPSAPRILSREVKFSSYEAVANGEILYILGNGVVEVVDVSNPLAPRGLGRVEIPTWSVPRGLATDGHQVFVGYEGDGIRVLPLHCARPTPVLVSDLRALPDARGVALSWSTREAEFAAFDILRMTAAPVQELAFIGTGERNAADGAWHYVDTGVTPGSTYAYSVRGIRPDGSSQSFGPVVARALPRQGITLGSISPFPARDAATIPFSLAERGAVRLEAFDARGRRVRLLLDAACGPGHHVVRWDGLGADGAHVSNGLYFVRLTTTSGSRVSRALFIR